MLGKSFTLSRNVVVIIGGAYGVMTVYMHEPILYGHYHACISAPACTPSAYRAAFTVRSKLLTDTHITTANCK